MRDEITEAAVEGAASRRPHPGPGFSLHELVVPAFSQGLANLSEQLDRAAEHARGPGPSFEDLLDARLAPDMHPLSSQVALAAFQAWECVNRLLGKPLPEVPSCATPALARDAIEQALAVLWECDRAEVDAASARRVEVRLQDGSVFAMRGRDYVRDWAIPQFYFHAVTAYALMRRAGVPLGKADFVPHMFRYLQPAA